MAVQEDEIEPSFPEKSGRAARVAGEGENVASRAEPFEGAGLGRRMGGNHQDRGHRISIASRVCQLPYVLISVVNERRGTLSISPVLKSRI